MMMTWGFFVFGLDTLPYQQLQRSAQWNHPTNTRVGLRAATQYVGQGNEEISLSGVLLPEITGGRVSIELARTMADKGEAWPLIERSGKMYGLFVCTGIDDSASEFFSDGTPRKIDFTIKLKRVGDDQTDLIGALSGMFGFLS